MANTNQPVGFYVRYLKRLREQREAKGEKAIDLDDEQYWRDREKWHAEQQREKQ
jgi:hypothetical protein